MHRKILPHCVLSALTIYKGRHAPPSTNSYLPCVKGSGLRQGSFASIIAIFSDTHSIQITQTLSAVKTEGLPDTNLLAFAITSADNPSVTVTENPVLYQHIFNLIYKTNTENVILHCDSSLYTREQIVILLFHTLYLTQNLSKLNVIQKELTRFAKHII